MHNYGLKSLPRIKPIRIYSLFSLSKILGFRISHSALITTFRLFVIFLYSIVSGLLFAVMIISISPFVRIRIGRLKSEYFGHFLMEYDWYATLLKSNKRKNSIDIFYFNTQTGNSFLKLKWAENEKVLPRLFLNPIYLVLRTLGSKTNKYIVPLPDRPTDFTVLDNHQSAIKFSQNEYLEGLDSLKSLGFGKEDNIVCLFVRDNAYDLTSVNSKSIELESYRNSSIDDYLELVKYLVGSGFKVIRMGKIAKDKLDLNNPNFFDYANSKIKSDFLDLFLVDLCKFCICTNSGTMMLPIALRKPVGLVNVPASHGLISSNLVKLFQFMTFCSILTNSDLSLSQFVDQGGWKCENSEEFRVAQMYHRKNSAAELYNFGVEFCTLLEHNFRYDDRHRFSQRKLETLLGNVLVDRRLPQISVAWLDVNKKFLS